MHVCITYLLFIYFIVIKEVVLVLEMRGGRAGGLASVCGTGLKLLKALNLNLGKK